MPARHILTFARDLTGGGVERALLRLADGWSRAGRRVTLVLGDQAGPLAGELSPAVEVVVLASPQLKGVIGPMHPVRRSSSGLLSHG